MSGAEVQECFRACLVRGEADAVPSGSMEPAGRHRRRGWIAFDLGTIRLRSARFSAHSAWR
jgi:hypothetical protein